MQLDGEAYPVVADLMWRKATPEGMLPLYGTDLMLSPWDCPWPHRSAVEREAGMLLAIFDTESDPTALDEAGDTPAGGIQRPDAHVPSGLAGTARRR